MKKILIAAAAIVVVLAVAVGLYLKMKPETVPLQDMAASLQGVVETSQEAVIAEITPEPVPEPITANTVEGPVTGALPDKIELQLSPSFGRHVYLTHKGSLLVSFCTPVKNGCIAPDRKIHLTGKAVTSGITLTPVVEGEWRWSTDYSLVFKPKNPWPTGQSYTVRFDKSIFPQNVIYTSSTGHFSTDYLSATIEDMTFFQDPEDMEKRGVSTRISFNTPVDVGTLKEHVSFVLEEVTEESKPNQRKVVMAAENVPFDMKLSEDGMSANVTVPLTTLPDKERFLKVFVKQGLPAKAGGEPLQIEKTERVLIPSRYSYAKLEPVKLQVIKNDKFEPEQILVIESNVPLTASELSQYLKIKQLPKDKAAATPASSPTKDYAWQSAMEVTEDLLKTLPDVSYKIVTTESASRLHSIKLDTDSGRWLYVRISHDLPAKGGYILANDHNDTVQVPEYLSEVGILSQGALLSLSGEKKISLYSLGANKLRFKIHRIIADDIGHFVSQTNGDFENPNFENYNFDENNISEVYEQELPLAKADLRKPQFSSFDFSPYLKKNPTGKGLFFLTVDGTGEDQNGKFLHASTKQLVLVSDLGFVVKTARDGSQDLFVQSIQSGEPVSGATVDVLGVNGLPVLSLKTDGQGHTTIPSLEGFTNEKRPIAYVVRQGDDISFMAMDRWDRRLNYSKFDTEGMSTSDEGLRAFLFSDRGVYRPGEDIHTGIMVKQGDWAESLEGLPLQVEIVNPQGKAIDKSVIKLTASGLSEYTFSTKDTSPTGIYDVRLYITKDANNKDFLGSTSVRVEEFLPDTLKITSEFNKPAPKGWVTPDGLKATVKLEHLYGAPAADHKVEGSISVIPGNFYFKEYPDYSFFDAKKTDKTFDEPAGEMQTDEEGKVTFDLKLSSFGDSTYRLTFFGEGYAQDSGRSVRTAKSVLVSSLPYVVGMKADGNLDYLYQNQSHSVRLLAVNSELKPIEVKNITAKLAEVTFVSSLVKDEQGAYAYRSVAKETVISTNTVNLAAGGTNYDLDSSKAGRFVLILSGADGLVLSRIGYSIIGEGDVTGRVRKEAALSVKLNKEQYNAGDTIEMNIVSPYTGTGLITLETDKVLAFRWFRTTTTSSVQSIDIPRSFTGKGFVNVQFVRALGSREIYTDPLAYNVQPFFVSTDSIDSKIQLSVPETIKPGETLSIGYATKTPGKIIVYAVDEGILQYGKYQTPKPLDYFVNKRALQVKTTQILDQLMPEYSLLQKYSAFGGDGALADGKNLNPFKRKTLPPVAYWSGILDADSTTKTVTYTVPDYFNGNLRVMAVAMSATAMGSAEGRTFVKGDLIVSPNVPTFAAPGDEFVVGLSLANNIKGSGKQAKVKLVVTPSEHVEVISGKDQEITVAENGEVKAQVRVKAKDVPGGASLMFVVTSGKSKAHYEATLSVRPPLPSMTVLASGYAEKGEKIVQQNRDLYKEFAKADATVSTLPVSLIPGLAQYLERFPYGCTEQTISKALPAVVLFGQPDLQADAKIVNQNVRTTMNRLRELQNYNGGFTYWWYGGQVHDFTSVYALHYMVIAKEKHLPVPDEVYRKAIEYVKNLVNRSPHSLRDARVQAYGIYLLTRSGEVTANYLPNLLKYLGENHKKEWKQDLTAVYIAAAYRLMQLVPEGNALLDEFTLGDPVYWTAHRYYWQEDSFYNSINRYAQYLTIVAEHFPDKLAKVDRNVLFRLANFIGEGTYNTLSSSYAIMAFSSYGLSSGQQVGAQLGIAQAMADGAFTSRPLTGEVLKRTTLEPAKSNVKFGGAGDYGLFYQIATDGYDKTRPTQPIQDGLEISRQYLNKDGQPVKEVKIGDIVDVVVSLRSHGNKTLENMAMVDLLPGGFEVVPDSITPPAPRPETSYQEQYSEGEEGGEYEGEAAHETEMPPEIGVLGNGTWRIEAVDVREDRLIAFGTITPGEVMYRYKIKAVNAGTFATPPAYAESMYDRTIKARGIIGGMVVR